MNLAQQLAPHKAAIVKKWFDRVLAGYHQETARFLSSQKDAFQNPVGLNTHKCLELLFDLLPEDSTTIALQNALDPIIRIRAIQDFTPAEAVGFIFDLRELIGDELPELARTPERWLLINRRIDAIALAAFNVYMQCREKIFDLKSGELRERTFKALVRAGLVQDPT